MIVELTDGTRLDAMGVHGQTCYYQGVGRDCLTFLFDPGKVPLERVTEAFTPENCAIIRISDESGTFLHEHYTLRLQAGQGFREYALNGNVGRDSEQCVFVKMAQSTLAERSILEQQAVLDALVAAALEGGE